MKSKLPQNALALKVVGTNAGSDKSATHWRVQVCLTTHRRLCAYRSLPKKKRRKRNEKIAHKQIDKIIQKVFVLEKEIKKNKKINCLLPCKF